jgi:hypothetical protein
METAPLKAFATKARTGLIKEIAGRISVVLAENSLARVEAASAVSALEKAIARDGLDRVTDQVAYTWFNRIIALRFMDANGYTGSGIVSPAGGQSTGQPEVLAQAKAGVFDDAIVPKKTQDSIAALFNGTRASQDRDGEAYGLLLESYCRSWNDAMPFMFEREGDYTELLIPTALLAADSVRDRAVKTLTEEICREVEVIGWLYQFYISDRKDEVFEGFKKNKKAGAAEIPAATQLFTPHWIVRYLVENSLGRLWLLNNPSSRLAEQMEYYIKPVDEDTEFLRIGKPEELKVIDPAVGSGHMLTYAFDLLYAIYAERGYDPAEIPGLILEHNLYGVEIDPRAGALAAFALTMKAAAKRKLFLKHPVQPNIRVLQNIHFDEAELDYLWSLTKADGFARSDADEFWNSFDHADIFGSLIQVKGHLIAPLKSVVGASAAGDLLHSETLNKAAAVVVQAEYLSQRHLLVVANPPYMGKKSMGALLAEFAARVYPVSKADLYSMFIERCTTLSVPGGIVGMITMQSWMFLGTFAELRKEILEHQQVVTVAHLGAGAFDSIGGQVVATTAFVRCTRSSPLAGTYIGLADLSGEATQAMAVRNASSGRELDRVYHVFDDEIRRIPLASMAYWLTAEERSIYLRYPPLSEIAAPRQGLATGDNDRFLRQWWEVSARRSFRNAASRLEAAQAEARWFPVQKGGASRRWAGNDDLVVNWEADGKSIEAFKPRSVVRNPSYFFRPGATWSSLSGEFAMRYCPPGSIFESKGGMLFPERASDLLWLIGYLNTPIATALIDSISPTLDYSQGPVGSIPVIRPEEPQYVNERVNHIIDLAREMWSSGETSPDNMGWLGGLARTASVSSMTHTFKRKMLDNEETILRTEDQIESHFRKSAQLSESAFRRPQRPTRLVPTGVETAATADRTIVEDLFSYAVGCMFGRYSLDQPGLVLANQASTLEDYLAQVPTPSFMPDQDNVIPIVDGDWFEDDVVARFRQFIRVAFGDEHFEENLRFVTESLRVKDIRDYFVKSFYDDHVKRYKKRPIYWLFRSPKGAFSALIYLHRYSPSTVSTVLTGYLREFIGKLEANLEHQGRVAAGMGGASARDIANAQKEADRIRKVLVELRDYEHDILFPLAGQQIALDLDDGVLVNYQKLGPALKDIGLKKGNSSE